MGEHILTPKESMAVLAVVVVELAATAMGVTEHVDWNIITLVMSVGTLVILGVVFYEVLQ